MDSLLKFSSHARSWSDQLASALRDPDQLIDRLGLPNDLRPEARRSAASFPLFVTESFVDRMRYGDVQDPLLLQVLPLGIEGDLHDGYRPQALDEDRARTAPGLLQKYAGRALLIATGSCAIHCRYCFRRAYPYDAEPRRLAEWEPAFQALARDASIKEVLLSGGDPLMLSDARLAQIVARLDAMPHLERLRIHTRLPIVLPQRVTASLLATLSSLRLTPIFVVHANHPAEVVGDCAETLRLLVRSGFTVLNQSVLLRGINDSADALAALSERLINLGVMPYYLHQLDRVSGTAHFEVPATRGIELIAELRRRLPGYAVPRYVREVPGEPHKTPLA